MGRQQGRQHVICRTSRYRRSHGGGHKDGHKGFHPCESRFLYFLVWRRPETGDRFEKEERQRIFPVVRTDHLWGPSFSFTYSQFSYCTATHTVQSTLSAAQGELPEGQERVPWGMTVSRNSLAWKLPTAPAKINCAKQTDSQVPSGITRSSVARHGHPPGDPLLPFGQFTLCRACVEQPTCVAVRCLRTANISRKTRCGNPTAVPLFEAVAGLWSAPDYEIKGSGS